MGVDQGMQFDFVASGENNAGACTRKGQCGLASDAAGRAGDNDDFFQNLSAHVEIDFTSRRRRTMVHGERLYCQCLCTMKAAPVAPLKKVLVIDDEPEILDVIKRCLEAAGFQVLTASGPQEGLTLYEKHRQQIGLVL